MIETSNVFGDIAGQFLTLKALIDKMPQGNLISLGDPNDRGPRSKEVIEFLMDNGDTVNSNHAHMMVEAWKQSANPGAHIPYYDKSVWFYNGGIQTMSSYDEDWMKKINFQSSQRGWDTIMTYDDKLHRLIPKKHINFLMNCPMYLESHKFVFSHAPLHSKLSLEAASELGSGFAAIGWSHDYESQSSLLWNRHVPEEPNLHLNGKINVFGHNPSDKVKIYTAQYPQGLKVTPESFEEFNRVNDFTKYPIYAICLDTSSAKVLTGLHLPTMRLYQQEYID